jgi:hypothetical protein
LEISWLAALTSKVIADLRKIAVDFRLGGSGSVQVQRGKVTVKFADRASPRCGNAPTRTDFQTIFVAAQVGCSAGWN